MLLPLLSVSAIAVAATSEPLRSGWQLASSASLAGAGGQKISGPSGASAGGNWSVLQQFPATVLAGLVEAGEYPELFFSQNLRAVETARFDVPWWYRVQLPAEAADNCQGGGKAILTFQGLNYRANIWFNGRLVANTTSIEGAYAYFDVDVSDALAAGGGTGLAVQVFRSYDWGIDCGGKEQQLNEQVSCRGKNKTESQDLGITWVDWAPAPHDANMGLWRDVVLTTTPAHSPPVTIRYPGVATTLSAGNTAATVEITAEVANWGSVPVSGSVHAGLGSGLGKAAGVAHLPAASTGRPGLAQVVLSMEVKLNPADDLWWPYQMGAANRHNLTLRFIPGAAAPDLHTRAAAAAAAEAEVSMTVLVGLRSASNEIDHNGNAVFRVNGQRILIRGGGYAPDLLQRMTHSRTRREMLLTKDMGLNAIRLEGKLQDDDLFDQCAELGILVLPGICCCDAWQSWDVWTANTHQVATASLRAQVKRLRRFPSVISFLYSSDDLPPPDVERAYLDVFESERWAVGLVSSASYKNSTLTGVSGVKMAGPYGWCVQLHTSCGISL